MIPFEVGGSIWFSLMSFKPYFFAINRDALVAESTRKVVSTSFRKITREIKRETPIC